MKDSTQRRGGVSAGGLAEGRGQEKGSWRESWWGTQLRALLNDGPALMGLFTLLLFFFLAIFGPYIVPHDPLMIHDLPDGRLASSQPPSLIHWFGTTTYARDVFSQIIIGARVAVIVGFLSAIATVFVGTNVGLWAGYRGGWVDDVLMRIVDITYGIPFLPFAIILVSLLGSGMWNVILVIALLFWRSTARVIRAQVLSLKERPFVWSAKAAGASDFHIVYRHIMPNVLPLVLLYTALGIGSSVLTEAGLSFLGFGNPDQFSWGITLRQAFQAGAARTAWWWIVPPGVAISLFVVAAYVVGRSIETIADPRLRDRTY